MKALKSPKDFHHWKDQVLEEFLFKEKSRIFFSRPDESNARIVLYKRIEEAGIMIKDGNSSPALYFIRGYLGQLNHRFYQRALIDSGKLNSVDNQAVIQEYQSYYLKALELDNSSSAPDRLSDVMLDAIANDEFVSPGIKTQALRKKTSFAHSDNPGPEHKDSKWNACTAMLSAYMDAEDYENALTTLNEMEESFSGEHSEEILNYKCVATISMEQRGQKLPERENPYTYCAEKNRQAVKLFQEASPLLNRNYSNHSSKAELLQGIEKMEQAIEAGIESAESRILLGNSYNIMAIFHSPTAKDRELWRTRKRNLLSKVPEKYAHNERLLILYSETVTSNTDKIFAFRKAFEIDPSRMEWGFSLGEHLMEEGRRQESYEVFIRAINSSDTSTNQCQYNFVKAMRFMLFKNGMHKEANKVAVLKDQIFDSKKHSCDW